MAGALDVTVSIGSPQLGSRRPVDIQPAAAQQSFTSLPLLWRGLKSTLELIVRDCHMSLLAQSRPDISCHPTSASGGEPDI